MIKANRARAEASTFLRFCIVGGGGFLVDAGFLAALTSVFGMGAIAARCISAPLAIVVTFVLNRIWAFGAAPDTHLVEAFFAYCAVQGLGFGINVLIYTGLVSWPFGWLGQPVAALGLASCAALIFNFVGIRFFAFVPGKASRQRAPKA